jgi:twitching motility protein PilT
LTGKEHGMQIMDQSLLAAIQAKEIDPDHAYLFANDKKQFARFVTDKTVLPTGELAPG